MQMRIDNRLVRLYVTCIAIYFSMLFGFTVVPY